jgi:hypothetical protein
MSASARLTAAAVLTVVLGPLLGAQALAHGGGTRLAADPAVSAPAVPGPTSTPAPDNHGWG